MEILYRIQMEGADLDELVKDVGNLIILAKNRSVETGTYDEAWRSRAYSEPDTEAEDLANDFKDAGYPVDFNDGPFITIYEKVDNIFFEVDSASIDEDYTFDHAPIYVRLEHIKNWSVEDVLVTNPANMKHVGGPYYQRL